MIIRDARFGDIKPLMAFLHEYHEKSEYSGIRIDDKTLERSLQVTVNDRFHQTWLVEVNDRLEGALIVAANQLWFSRKREAVDVFYYVTDKARGAGAALLRKYIAWARSEPTVARIMLGVTSNDVKTDRTERMYELFGAKRVGSIHYILVDDHERCSQDDRQSIQGRR